MPVLSPVHANVCLRRRHRGDATLQKALKGKESLPSGIRAVVIRDLQKTKQSGVTGTIRFEQYGDIVAATFTLYQVAGSPLAWTPVAKSGTTSTK